MLNLYYKGEGTVVPDVKFLNIEHKKQKKWEDDDNLTVFNVKCPRVQFGKKGNRILFVVDRISTEDLSNGYLLSAEQGVTFENTINHTLSQLKDNCLSEYLVVNFPVTKVTNLADNEKQKIEKQFFNRIGDIALKYKPDCVVFLGYDPLKYAKVTKPFEPHLDIGRIFQFKYKKRKLNFLFTLSMEYFATTKEDKVHTNTNSIGFVSYHLKSAFLNKNIYDIQKLVDNTKQVYIDSIKKFDKFLKVLYKSKIVAIDTEGTSLNKISNKLVMAQFFTDADMQAYIIPLWHMDTPFTSEQLDYIVNKLITYIQDGKSKYHVYHNASYDVTTTKSNFKINYYGHELYDTMAGEFSLDENIKTINRKFNFANKKMAVYGLEFLERKYGYTRPQLATDKENRATIANRPLSESIEYAGIDPTTTYYIHMCQKAEAKSRGIDYSRFEKIVYDQIGSMIHVFSEMEYNGTYIDKEYLMLQRSKDSDLNKLIASTKEAFRNSKAAKKVNKHLLKKKGAPKQTLFGGDSWIFSITRPEHRYLLYYKALKLEPVSIGKSGRGSTDKKFQTKYKDTVPEVKLLADFNQATKMRDTFIKGIWKKLISNPDSKLDGRIRPSYGFTGVLTGRSSCQKPNMQQIPSHGHLAKIIKRIFVAQEGFILVEFDFSAHEVRCWANASSDVKLSESFRHGLKLRQKLRTLKKLTVNSIKEIKKHIEDKGDIHSNNYKFFFGRPPRDKGERQGIKAVVFGVIYGKGPGSLAIDINPPTKRMKIEALNKQINEIDNQIAELEDVK